MRRSLELNVPFRSVAAFNPVTALVAHDAWHFCISCVIPVLLELIHRAAAPGIVTAPRQRLHLQDVQRQRETVADSAKDVFSDFG